MTQTYSAPRSATLSPGGPGGPFWRLLSACRWMDGAAELFRQCTGRAVLPTSAFQFIWLVIGRRGGKSFCMAIIAVFLACFKDWRAYLAPGERAVVLLVAADREQAKILHRYICGILVDAVAGEPG